MCEDLRHERRRAVHTGRLPIGRVPAGHVRPAPPRRDSGRCFPEPRSFERLSPQARRGLGAQTTRQRADVSSGLGHARLGARFETLTDRTAQSERAGRGRFPNRAVFSGTILSSRAASRSGCSARQETSGQILIDILLLNSPRCSRNLPLWRNSCVPVRTLRPRRRLRRVPGHARGVRRFATWPSVAAAGCSARPAAPSVPPAGGSAGTGSRPRCAPSAGRR